MIKKILLVVLPIVVSSCTYNVNKESNFNIDKPLSILMYSPNYNERPSKSKIDTIVIHHTAPFYSLTRVGYYFQDINSRVSSHYIVGKEGLIIESVSDDKRAWHAGYSSWKGKFNVNDYSIGIEVLNDGDGKDKWTEPQYESLAKLTSYLIKRYDIPLENVIGHKDIAIPLGRKIDPADNFDWSLFKNKIRKYLRLNISYYDNNPQRYNFSAKDMLEKLKSDNLKERIDSINSLLTIKNSNYIDEIKKSFINEKYNSVKPYYYRFFTIYKNNSFIQNALEIINNFNNYPVNLFKSSLEYLYENYKENLFKLLITLSQKKDIEEKYKIQILNTLSFYNSKKEVINILVDNYFSSKEKNTKLSILQFISEFKNTDVKKFLVSELEKDNLIEIKSNIIKSLTNNYDNDIENILLKILDYEKNNDILNSIALNLIRNKSINGIYKLQNTEIFNSLTKQNKLALINMCGILKINEQWLIDNSKSEIDKELLSAYLIAISKFKSKDGLNYIMSIKFEDEELEFTRIKSLGYYEDEKINNLIKTILFDKNSRLEYKLLCLSFLNDRKLKNFLPLLKVLYVENKDIILEFAIKDTINSIENYKDDENELKL